MKQKSIINLVIGVALVGLGTLTLAGNTILKLDGWRLWPVLVILLGAGLTAPGFWGFRQRGLGSFFIPGLPLIATGLILLAGSITRNYALWSQAWPFEVIALAAGFILAAIFMRLPALAIPAFVLGLNGALLAFCTLTGLWQAWILMWPVEPLGVGLGILMLAIFKDTQGMPTWGINNKTARAAMILFFIAAGGFLGMSFISVFNATILRFGAPILLILTGALITSLSLFRQKPSPMQVENLENNPVQVDL